MGPGELWSNQHRKLEPEQGRAACCDEKAATSSERHRERREESGLALGLSSYTKARRGRTLPS